MRIALIILSGALVQRGKGSSLADFTNCIGAQGQGPVCQLDAGNYQLSVPLQIARSNITVKGTIVTSLADTTLQRAPGSARGLLVSTYGGNIRSITVRDFTFDGNRIQQTATASSIEPEVRFISVNSFLITHVAFINSPNVAITIEANPGQPATSGAVVNNISIDNAALLGLLSQAAGPSGAPGQYLTCPSLTYPSSIRIANSMFSNTGANAIAIEATGVQMIGNTLRHNHETAPYNAPGGQIYVTICADDVAMVNNSVSDGPVTANGYFGEGLELHGTNLVAIDNTITNNAGPGIQMSGAQNVFISNWTPGTGVISNDLLPPNLVGGIDLYNAAPGDVNERQVDFITIDHAISINGKLAGIGMFLQTGQTNLIQHVTITNNCLAGNLNGPTRLPGLGSDVVVGNNLSSGCP